VREAEKGKGCCCEARALRRGGRGGEGKKKNAQWPHYGADNPELIGGAEMSSRQQRPLFEFGNLLHGSRIIRPASDDK